jgi:hypothetical protein
MSKQREALEAALYEVHNYLAAWKAGAKADTNGLQLLIPKIETALAEQSPQPLDWQDLSESDGKAICMRYSLRSQKHGMPFVFIDSPNFNNLTKAFSASLRAKNEVKS